MPPTKIFISYSHQDADWLQRVQVHLSALRRMYEIDIWDDRKISAGSKWRDEIAEAVGNAKIAILLISADFLFSEFIANNELPPLLSDAEKGGTLILPLILSPSYFLRTEHLSKFQAVNDPSRPLVNLSKGDQEQILVSMVERIEAYLVASASQEDRLRVEDDDRIEIKKTLPNRSDLRLVIDVWVGREAELKALAGMSNGVIAVTGVGGQGKSFLVAKFLEDWITRNPNEFWDWRDCKEEGEQFFTQLIALIEHFTQGRIKGDDLLGADTREAVRYFFEVVGDNKGLIVLDNVDHYINQTDQMFRLGVGVFVEEALRFARNILVVLTCRARVSYGSPRYMQVPLSGVDLDEAIELFDLRRVNITTNKAQIEEIWALTEGHPLWLNLIATQMERNPRTTPNIVDELRRSHDDRTRVMFRALWKGLTERQRTVLRSMSEVRYAETKESIENLLGELAGSRNQFNRAFEGLRTLSLIVERGARNEESTFDLHPLVRNFVRTEFPTRKDRLPFIHQILSSLDRLIAKLKAPEKDASLEDLQRWSAKAELEFEAFKHAAALETISHTSDQLVARGFHEEFFRVAKPVLGSIDWSSIEMQDSHSFHEVVEDLIETLVEQKREAEAREYLQRYQRSTGTTSSKLRFLKTAAYIEWMLGNFSKAIEISREGLALRDEALLDTTKDTDVQYTLALALRDSGQFDEALRIFAADQSIADILNEDHSKSGKGGPFYGNIGRCLQLKGELQQALRCFAKSAALLTPPVSAIDVLNKGFATLWIGEMLQSMGKVEIAFYFYRLCVQIWSRRAPLKVTIAEEHLSQMGSSVSSKLQSLSDADIAYYCDRWIESHLRS